MEGKTEIFLIGLFVVVATASVVVAQIGVPSQFYGDVSYNGASAPDGMSITAKIDGVIVEGTTTLAGKYGYNPLFFITDPGENREGKTIIFYVNNIQANSHVFENGVSTKLDLACSSSSNGDSGGGSGGGGGGGGGGSGGGASSSVSLSGGGGTDSEEGSEDGEEGSVGGGMTGGVVGSSGAGSGIVWLFVIIIVALSAGVVLMNKKKSKMLQ